MLFYCFTTLPHIEMLLEGMRNDDWHLDSLVYFATRPLVPILEPNLEQKNNKKKNRKTVCCHSSGVVVKNIKNLRDKTLGFNTKLFCTFQFTIVECGQSFSNSWPDKWRLFANLNYSVHHREMQLLTSIISPCGILRSVSLPLSFYATTSQWCLSWLSFKAAADCEAKTPHFFSPVAALHNFVWNQWKNSCLLQ